MNSALTRTGTGFADASHEMKKAIAAWRKVALETVKNWLGHGSMSESAALAFYTVFSLAPVLLVVITVAGAVFGQDAVRGRIVRQFEGLMGREQAVLVQTVISKAQEQKSGGIAAIVGIVTLVIGATGVFAQLQSSLNRIWEVEPRPGHFFTDFLRKRLLSFALVLAIGFVLMVSLVLSAGIEALQTWAADRMGGEALWMQWGNALVSFLLFAVFFTMIYRVLPDARIPWRDVWLGALSTSILFVIGKWAIGAYLGRTAASTPFGAAGSVIVLLLWVYYASLIVLLGAEFTRAYSRHVEEAARPPEAGAKRRPAAKKLKHKTAD